MIYFRWFQGPREEVPGLVERIKVLFPDFTDVGEPGAYDTRGRTHVTRPVAVRD
jgi:hypothetical protein